jgi:hypothetical protein
MSHILLLFSPPDADVLSLLLHIQRMDPAWGVRERIGARFLCRLRAGTWHDGPGRRQCGIPAPHDGYYLIGRLLVAGTGLVGLGVDSWWHLWFSPGWCEDKVGCS